MAVLKVRFKDVGVEKLERNEFLLSDEKQNRDLDIRKPWHAVMKPGQHVSMRMVFDTEFQLNSCPGCMSENHARKGSTNCGLTYRLVEEKVAQPPVIHSSRRQSSRQNGRRNSKGFPNIGSFGSTTRATVADFRRVHLISRTAVKHYKCKFAGCSRSFSTDLDRKRHESSDHFEKEDATMSDAGAAAAIPTTDTLHGMSDLEASTQRAAALADLEAMGFEKKEIDAAMRAAFYNHDRAFEYLLNVRAC